MSHNYGPIPRTRVACYYCSEFFEEKDLQAHIHQCRHVLERCPYKCGVYVPRNMREKHAKECVKGRNRMSTGSIGNNPDAPLYSIINIQKRNPNVQTQPSQNSVVDTNSHYNQVGPTTSMPRNDIRKKSTGIYQALPKAQEMPSTQISNRERTLSEASTVPLDPSSGQQTNRGAPNVTHMNRTVPNASRVIYQTDATLIRQPSETASISALVETVGNLETEIISLRTSLTEERNQRLQFQVKLSRLEKAYKELDGANKSHMSNFEIFQRLCNEDNQNHNIRDDHLRLEMDKLQLRSQLIDEWKKQLEKDLASLRDHVVGENTRHVKCELALNNMEQRLFFGEKLADDLESLKDAVLANKCVQEEENLALKIALDGFQEYQTKENLIISGLWNDQLKEIENFKTEFKQIDDEIKDILLKQHALSFETKSNGQTATENVTKIELLTKNVELLRKTLAQLRQDLTDISEIINSLKNSEMAPAIFDGHLLWKITNYKAKLENSKENDTVIKSPIFYDRKYGYAIRAEIHLNGIGRWKDRHMIASVEIVPGEWDDLLDWPCVLAATVILRDQSSPSDKSKNLIKTLNAKRKTNAVKEELQETSKQHIFIPHSVINKQSFIKNDTIFVEILLNSARM